MSSIELLVTQISQLPQIYQDQVADFVDFLIFKYTIPIITDETSELSQEEKDELDLRLEYSQKHPEQRSKWDDIKAELFSKYHVTEKIA
jgi:hypothetical protein